MKRQTKKFSYNPHGFMVDALQTQKKKVLVEQ
jgi:hypothetical protein